MLIPPGETVVETKPCRSCGTSFVVTDRDMDFYDRISPVFAGKKEPIPPPTLCPDCRQRRRMAWRNERKLYRRKCDLTGRDIVSIHSPDKSSTVYHPDAWWGDGWDTLSYGREYDFSRSASEQLRELSAVVPKKALNQKGTNENSEYCNIIKSMKDCYLCFAATESEGVMYSNWL